ncbi:group II intron maturase-specific domain-containing protein [Nostoc sp. C052]|uniref:group II intron maturase-specific domain-containing protein n=1 Tax=Nostoc sp. C052 TaxID=2576902 RepID=UPI001C4AA70B|nr:group II intron maturase-specific domain-containing protein [Nostoc sp. C052]
MRISLLLNPVIPEKESENYKDSGFDFLGFNVRQYEVDDNHSAKSSQGKLLGFKTLIKPSKKAIKKHYDAIAEIIDAYKSASQAALIAKLNPIQRGWTNYYSTKVSSETFSKLDYLVELSGNKAINPWKP